MEKPKQDSILINAILNGNVEEVESLIGSGGLLPYISGGEVNQFLCNAIRSENFEMAQFLLKHNCSVTSRTLSMESPLHVAAEKGNFDIVSELLDKGALINARDQDGNTALHLAVMSCHSLVVELLLARKARIDVTDKTFKSPLFIAIEMKNLEFVRMLFKTESVFSALNLRDSNGISPLLLAVQYSDTEIAHLLIEEGASVTTRDNNGKTVLHYAIEFGNLELFMLMLNQSVKRDKLLVNARDKNGQTPLHLSVKLKHNSISKLLIAKEALLYIYDDYGKSPLHTALEVGNLDVVPMLLAAKSSANVVNVRDDTGNTPLSLAIKFGYTNIIKLLLIKNASVSVCDRNQKSPFHNAIEHGNLDIVPLFFTTPSYHAALNIRDKNGNTALHLAAKFGYRTIVELLIKKGASVDVYDSKGKTPLFIAIDNNNADIVPLLLKSTAVKSSLNACDSSGETPLHLAAKYHKNDVVESLLGQGASVDIRNNIGELSLHTAIENGNLDIVPSLLSHSVSINAQDRNGQTALHLAAEHGCDSIVESLLEQGASIFMCDKRGASPLHIAFRKKNVKLVSMLLNHIATAKSQGEKSLFLAVRYGESSFIRSVQVRNEETEKSQIFINFENGNKELEEVVRKYGAWNEVTENDKIGILFLSIGKNNLPCVEFLLSAGADANAVTEKGLPLIYVAMDSGSNEMCQLLLHFGAHTNFVDDNGKSLLHIAVERHRNEIVKLLLEREVDVNKKTNDGITPLYIAAKYGNRKVCELLLKFKADANIGDPGGKVPLHLAVSQSRMTAKTLVNNRADVNKKANDGTTPCTIAATYADVKMCELLLEFGANANVLDNDGKSPLHHAVELFHYDYSKLLLSKKADVNMKSNEGATPLYIACRNGNKKMCQLLLNAGADAHLCDGNGKSPLHFAVEKDRCDLAEMLLEHHAYPNKKTSDDVTPLYTAALKGQEQMFSLLLKFGAKIGSRMKQDFENILLNAVSKELPIITEFILKNFVVDKEKFIDVFKTVLLKSDGTFCRTAELLVDHGFYISDKDVNDKQLVFVVVKNGCLKILHDLFKYGLDANTSVKFCGASTEKLLLTALKNKQNEVVKILLSHGATVEVDGEKSPLIYAAENADFEILQLLLQRVDASCNSESVSAAFNIAVWLGRTDIVEMFIHQGYDLRQKDSFGKSALHYTVDRMFCRTGKESEEDHRNQVARILLKHGADANAEMNDGMTTFMVAVNNNYFQIVETLLLNNVNVNCMFKGNSIALSSKFSMFEEGLEPYYRGAPAKPHCSALHIAIAKNNVELVELLLHHKANIDSKDKEGITPLHVAVWRGNVTLAEQLITLGAEIDCKDNNGATALNIAALISNSKLFKLLLDNGSDINSLDVNNQTLLSYFKKGLSNTESKIKINKNKSSAEILSQAISSNFEKKLSDLESKMKDTSFAEIQSQMNHILAAHVVKLSRANLYLREVLYSVSTPGYPNDLSEKCEFAAVILMSEVVDNSEFTFYDILTSSMTQLMACMKTISFAVIETESWKTEHNLYYDLIRAKLKIAENRMNLLNDAASALTTLFPSLCDYSCFTNEDLRRLIYNFEREQSGRLGTTKTDVSPATTNVSPVTTDVSPVTTDVSSVTTEL